MLGYIGKRVTTTVAGQRLEHVQCEKCGTKFYYELTRAGTGRSSAPYYLFQSAAADRAQSAAERDLEKRLSREAEMVPCPKCNWVNQDLIERYRRRKSSGIAIWILIIIIIGGMLGGAAYGFLSDTLPSRSRVPGLALRIIWGVTALSPLWVLWLFKVYARRIDPNRTYPRVPDLPAATPPALIERRDPRTGEWFLEPAPRPSDVPHVAEDGVVLRPGEFILPPLCCVCLEGATTTYRTPFKVTDDSELEVPLCRRCASRLLRRWWTLALLVMVMSAVIGDAMAMLGSDLDVGRRWGVFGFVSLVGAIFGVAIIPNRLCRPYRLVVLDADRGIVKFAARNPAYTESIAARSRVAPVPSPGTQG